MLNWQGIFFINTFTSIFLVLHFNLNFNCSFVHDRKYKRMSWNRAQRLINENPRSPRKVSKQKQNLKTKRQTEEMNEKLTAVKENLSKVHIII